MKITRALAEREGPYECRTFERRKRPNERMQLTRLTEAPIRAGFGSPARLRATRAGSSATQLMPVR